MQSENESPDVPPVGGTKELGGWMAEVRSQPVPPAVANAPPPRPRRSALFAYLAPAGVAVLVLGVVLWLLLQPPATEVRGIVCDARGAPRDGALVFVVGDPQRTVTTDPEGGFALRGVRPGRHTLVVVCEKIGQEFSVFVPGEGETDVGHLAYLAPPGG